MEEPLAYFEKRKMDGDIRRIAKRRYRNKTSYTEFNGNRNIQKVHGSSPGTSVNYWRGQIHIRTKMDLYREENCHDMY